MSSACSAPLTASLMRMDVLSERIDARVGDCARRKRGRDPAAIVGRGMEVGQRLDIGERRKDHVLDLGAVETVTHQLPLGIRQPDRNVGRGADTDSYTLAP